MRIWLFTFFIACSAWADAARVLDLRQEVEKLANELEAQKKEQQAVLDVYLQRRQELQALILREKFRADQLATQKSKLSQALKEKSLDAQGSPKAPAWFAPLLARLQDEIDRGLPLGERADDIGRIRTTLAQGKTTVESSLVQTWFVLEGALKRRTSSEFLLTPLRVGGVTAPAEVVRLGDLLAYVRTADGVYGMVSRPELNAPWELKKFEGSKEAEQVERLLSQFKQNQKTGLYHLPGMQTFVEQVRAEKNI